MDIHHFKPEVGFWSFYAGVIRKCWWRMILVSFSLEAVISVIYLFTLLASSKETADLFLDYIMRHALIVTILTVIAALWVFLVNVHYEHKDALSKKDAASAGAKDSRLETAQDRIGDLERDIRDKQFSMDIANEQIERLRGENAGLNSKLAELRDAHEFRHALSLVGLRREDDPGGQMASFRIEVFNNHEHRTVDGVCVRVVGLVRLDQNDASDLLSNAKPLLAISKTSDMPYNPPETRRNLVALDSLIFDFVTVNSHRRTSHSLGYGEYVKWTMFEGKQLWRRQHNDPVQRGKYKVAVEVQGRDVISVRKEFVFWGDKTGTHCVDANDPSIKLAQPLEYATIDLETLHADMPPHQIEALKSELKKPEYDGKNARDVYWTLTDDGFPSSLSGARFVTEDQMQALPENVRDKAFMVSDEYMAQFPGGVPGFPHAIRLADFEIAWKAARSQV